ncbi:MAG: bifunctional serine/threonine-protein kinase/formylglycine-generating enzyme family protein [Planctomycetota bacterium]
MSRGPRDEPAQPQDPHAFECLLASALRVLESEGEPGLERLLAQDPSSASMVRAELARLHAVGLADTLGATAGSGAAGAMPATIGAYEIVRRLGAGGMGEVYLARQHHPVEREVALKVVRGTFPDRAARARFAVECQVLSRMQHDGIARVFEVGETADGVPYLTMEYVRGASLTRYCDAHRLTIAQRVDLVGRVCEAVAHAHRNGVIHRDLKPDNILVVEQDGRAVPKVIDFGLARPLEREPAGKLTRSGFLLGTIQYMSPEQVDAGDAVDTRTDVYSLGVLLYELLVGRPPLVADGVPLGTFLERLRREDPPRLAATAAAASPAVCERRRLRGPPALRRLVSGDLEGIAWRALSRTQQGRYGSVGELGDDLRRHLARLPVRARPPSAWYVASRFVSRHRVGVGVAALLAVVGAGWVGRELVTAGELRRRDARFDRLALGARMNALQVEAEGDKLTRRPGFLFAGFGKAPPVATLDDWLARADALADERRAFDGETFAASVAGDAREYLLGKAARQLTLQNKDFSVLAQRVRLRRAWSAGVARATLEEAAPAWQRAIEAIRTSPRYGGLELVPQLGLIPLRENPATGLWEFRFWDPQGEPPHFDDDGHVRNATTFDPVFVLLPGGTAMIGSDDDAWAADVEKPRHSVDLAPFFLCKYELTRGQWRRWTGGLPLSLATQQIRHVIDDAYPVSDVSWDDCGGEAWGHGLSLPTEAQWEYAARAGTDTPWWTGGEPSTLAQQVNLADRSTRAGQVPAPWYSDELGEDGYAMTAPVDALAANGFGLHHVLGNVWEWTSGCYTGSYAEMGDHRPGDGFLRASTQFPDNDKMRVCRGGSYLSTWLLARSATRVVRHKDTKSGETGLRLARPVIGGR